MPAQVLFKNEGKNGRQRQLGVHNNRNPVDSKERRIRAGEPVPLNPLILPMTLLYEHHSVFFDTSSFVRNSIDCGSEMA